jgi:hypothetical protein
VVLLLEGALVSWSLGIDERDRHKDLRGSDHRSVIPYIHRRTGLYCSNLPYLCELEPYLFLTDGPLPVKLLPVRAFYSSRLGNYNEFRGPIGGLGVGQTLCCRVKRVGIANDVFNGVDMPGTVTCHPALGQWYGVSSMESSCLIALLH